jgi:DNA-binding transcriptional ArsR family regulator
MVAVTPFEALADPNRRRILDLLRAGVRPAGDIVDALTVSQPAVSKHLRVLREAGLVDVQVDGQRRLYSLAPGGLAEVEDWLKPHRRFWADRLAALEAHLEHEQ